MSEQENKKQKKKGGKAAPFAGGTALGLVLGILAMLGLNKLPGLGAGSSLIGDSNTPANSPAVSDAADRTDPPKQTEATATEQDAPAGEPTAEAENLVVVIEITDGTATVGENSFTDAAELKEYLVSINRDGSTYILRDNHAVKELYDAVEAMLNELHYSYTPETA